MDSLERLLRLMQGELLALYEAAIASPDTFLLRKIDYLDGWVTVSGALLPEDGALSAEQVAWAEQQASTRCGAFTMISALRRAPGRRCTMASSTPRRLTTS